MDYHTAFAISASGMAVEKTRLDVTALNLANASSTRAGGALYQPLTVISAPRQAAAFSRAMAAYGRVSLDALPTGAEGVEVRPNGPPPGRVYEPAHPDADARGYVAYPGINPVTEMVNII